MQHVIIVFHLMLVLSLIGVVLLQRSDAVTGVAVSQHKADSGRQVSRPVRLRAVRYFKFLSLQR